MYGLGHILVKKKSTLSRQLAVDKNVVSTGSKNGQKSTLLILLITQNCSIYGACGCNKANILNSESRMTRIAYS